jgi:hypothetical protein
MIEQPFISCARLILTQPGRAITLGSAIVLLVHAPAVYAILTLAMIGWALPSYLVLREELEDRQETRGRAEQHVRTIGAALRAAQVQIRQLEDELAEARAVPHTSEDRDATYRKVGLHPLCPTFVLAAARRAYRSALHPDRHPEHRKAEAHDRYVAVEATFAEIERGRSAHAGL